MRELVRLLSGNAPSRYRQHEPLDSQERAIRLLMENISPKQRTEYGRRKRFEVVGGDTGRRYRIHHGNQMNIELLDKQGRRVRVLCFMPLGDLAVGDVMPVSYTHLTLPTTPYV